MSVAEHRPDVDPSQDDELTSRWGVSAPFLVRAVAIVAWLALTSRLLASALPGSRSGIELVIRRADALSSLLTQLAVLLGSAELVLLVAATLSEQAFSTVYRIVIVPGAAAVLMLVMLASTMGLEPEASVALGMSCLTLAAAAAATCLRTPSTRAQGLVLALVGVATASRLAARVAGLDATASAAPWLGRPGWLSVLGYAFDTLAVTLAAVRLMAEGRMRARIATLAMFVAAVLIAWGALRGSLDGARVWQVLASRSLAELVTVPPPARLLAGTYTVESFAVLLAGTALLWPGRLSLGMVSAALAVLTRPGIDVPASALVLAVAALAAPLGTVRDAAGTVAVTKPASIVPRSAGVDG